MTTTTSTSRKVLVPFATLVAAGAVAIGSGATFTSESDSTISATSGIVEHSNSSLDDAELLITNLKPGGTATGTLTITNVGSLNSDLKVIASGATGDLVPALQLKIEGEDGVAFDDDFEKVDDNSAGYALGDLVAGQTPDEDSITVTVTVRMEDQGSLIDNTFQDTSADLSLKFVTTQTATDDESVVDGWNLP